MKRIKSTFYLFLIGLLFSCFGGNKSAGFSAEQSLAISSPAGTLFINGRTWGLLGNSQKTVFSTRPIPSIDNIPKDSSCIVLTGNQQYLIRPLQGNKFSVLIRSGNRKPFHQNIQSEDKILTLSFECLSSQKFLDSIWVKSHLDQGYVYFSHEGLVPE